MVVSPSGDSVRVAARIDGALRLAAELRGADAVKAIQLYIAYAPEPPFDSGTPETLGVEVAPLS